LTADKLTSSFDHLIFLIFFLQTMKMELVVGLLIYLVTVTLANVVPAVDQKVTVGAVAIELVESAESIESLGNNDPKVSIVDVTKESVSPTKLIESVETTETIESAESTESSVDNDVLKTSETFHRRYYYYPRTYYYPRYHYPQYYRQPVAFGYYNRYQPQQPHNANRYSYNRPSSSPVYYTQSTTSSPVHYTKSTTSSPVYYTQSTTPDSDDVPYDFSAY
jgi:hypothetical protein